jgi:hypothetical protein
MVFSFHAMTLLSIQQELFAPTLSTYLNQAQASPLDFLCPRCGVFSTTFDSDNRDRRCFIEYGIGGLFEAASVTVVTRTVPDELTVPTEDGQTGSQSHINCE